MAEVVPITDLSGYMISRANLLDALKGAKIRKIEKGYRKEGKPYISQRGDIIGHIGRTVTFGYGRIRHRGYGPYVANRKMQGVYNALCDFADYAIPKDFVFHTITLNEDVKAKKHIDRINVGDSIIVGIGDYEGGALRVYTNETDYVAEPIKDRPIKFNGATLYHETEDFSGKRYTMIFYKQRGDGFPRPSKFVSEETKKMETEYWAKVDAYWSGKRKCKEQIDDTKISHA